MLGAPAVSFSAGASYVSVACFVQEVSGFRRDVFFPIRAR